MRPAPREGLSFSAAPEPATVAIEDYATTTREWSGWARGQMTSLVLDYRETTLAAHNVQDGIVSLFRTGDGTEAIEFDGSLQAWEQNLGFGTYSAIDRSLRFPTQVALPEGAIQIADAGGSPGTWKVSRDQRFAWITKERGTPSIPDGAFVQLRRTYDGAISMKGPQAS